MDLLDEIKEDIKEEKFAEMWKKYGIYVISLAVLSVVLTASIVFYNSWKVAKYQGLGSDLYYAQLERDKSNFENSEKIYNKISEGSEKSITAIAKLNNAFLALEIGEEEKAYKIFNEVANDEKFPEEISQYARLIVLIKSLNDGNSDDIDRILSSNIENTPWSYSFLEIKAFYKLSKKDNEKAKEIFNNLVNDVNTPLSIKNRSNEMLDWIKLNS